MPDLWPTSPPPAPRDGQAPDPPAPAGRTPLEGRTPFPASPPLGVEPLVHPPSAWPSLEVDRPRGLSPGRAATFGGLAGAIVVLLVAAVAGVVVDDGGGDSAAVTSAQRRPPITTGGGNLDIQGILAGVQRSVVAIETATQTSAGGFEGAGSGIVLSDDGFVLTNAHVVGAGGTITVVLWDGSRHDAELVGSVPEDDLAVVRISARALDPAPLGSSDDLQVGEPVIAIGNALNLGGPPSVTQGIVSAKDRSIRAPGVELQGLIQTDAAINPGNSGGPLVNASGEVVGINTAILEDSQNIGFAIAIDLAKPIIEQIESGGGTITPDTAFLGLTASDLDDVAVEVRDVYGITADSGAMVSDVIAGEAAADAGLQRGDVIVEIDGNEIAGSADVGVAVRSHKPGDRVQIAYEREGQRRTTEAVLGRRG
jgi:S1-C subfamily serine protease